MHHGTELFERSKVMGRGGARCEGACLHVFLRPIRSDDDDQKIRPPMLAAAIIETYDAQNEASTTACAAQRSTLESMRKILLLHVLLRKKRTSQFLQPRSAQCELAA